MVSVLVWQPRAAAPCSRAVVPRGASALPSKDGFPIVKTIKSSADITRLFKEGRRINTPELSLIVLRNEGQHDQQGRVAFIAGKKLGRAVWRNRAKRRMREACRDVGGPFPGYDAAFVARKKITESSYADIVEHIISNLEKSGLFKYE